MDEIEPERKALKRNEVYYCDIVVFQVEDELFKVPKEQFERRSGLFQDLFSLPQKENPGSGVIEGSHDDYPIVLSGDCLTKSAFLNLLQVLYPRPFHRPDYYIAESQEHGNEMVILVELDIAQWISVYQLASMWLMEDVKELAVSKVNLLVKSAHPLKRIGYGRAYNREDWVLGGYKDIIERWEDVPDNIIEEIGASTALKLQRLMIQRLRSAVTSGYRAGTPGVPIASDKEPMLSLDEVFKDEIANIRDRGSSHSLEAFPGPKSTVTELTKIIPSSGEWSGWGQSPSWSW